MYPTTGQDKRNRRNVRGKRAQDSSPQDPQGAQCIDESNSSVAPAPAAALPVPHPAAANPERNITPEELECEHDCSICTEQIQIAAIGDCNHRICHACALRMRALYKNMSCSMCKVGSRTPTSVAPSLLT